MKKTLVLDSHGLSDYQHCPRLFSYTQIDNIEPSKQYEPFTRGRVIAKMLEEYYKEKLAKTLRPASYSRIVDEILKPAQLETNKDLIESRFYSYCHHYKNESWIPLAIEESAAFSRILYEDDEYLFVYEGRPDLVVQLSNIDSTRIVVDNKHQTRHYDLYFYNNQAMGYCWGLEIDFFCYNYFGLQESGGPKDWFRRPSTRFSKFQLEQWKHDTIKWYFAIARDVDYLKTWRCEGKYSLCAYHELCEQTLPNVIAIKKEREFKQKEHKVW